MLQLQQHKGSWSVRGSGENASNFVDIRSPDIVKSLDKHYKTLFRSFPSGTKLKYAGRGRWKHLSMVMLPNSVVLSIVGRPVDGPSAPALSSGECAACDTLGHLLRYIEAVAGGLHHSKGLELCKKLSYAAQHML